MGWDEKAMNGAPKRMIATTLKLAASSNQICLLQQF